MSLRAGIPLLLVLAATSTARAETRDACIPAFDEGQALREKLELRAARERFVECARDTCPGPIRKDCAEALEQVTRDQPTVVLAARDAHGVDVLDARIWIDGAPVVTEPAGRSVILDPGTHDVRFEHPRYRTSTQRVLVNMGEHNRAIVATLEAVAPPDEPPVRTTVSPSVWALTGVSVAGLGAFAILGGTGLSERSRLESRCAPACTDADLASLKVRFIAADLTLLVGLITGGGAAYLYVRDRH